MKIVRYGSYNDIDVEFLDEHHYIKEHQTYSNFKTGSIKNPLYAYMVEYCMKYGDIPNNQEIANHFKISRQAAHSLRQRLNQKIRNFIEL